MKQRINKNNSQIPKYCSTIHPKKVVCKKQLDNVNCQV